MIAIIILLLAACGEAPSVPASVKTAFDQKFTDAKSVKWEKENDTEWEAEFKLKGNEYSANFNADGSWVETEHEIQLAELPALIKTAIETDYPELKIEEIEISEKADGILYEITLEGVILVYNADGKLVNKVPAKEGDDVSVISAVNTVL